MIDNVAEYITENHWDDLESTANEEEAIDDLLVAAHLLSVERARALKEETTPSTDDIEHALFWICALPLMPKDDDEKTAIRTIRQPLIQDVANYGALPVHLSTSVLTSEETTLLDFEVPRPDEDGTIPIGQLIKEIGVEETTNYVRAHREDFWASQHTHETEYARDVLVSADWVEDRLDQFQADDPEYRLVEVDVDTEAYDEAHAPGAIGFNWETQLQDQTQRDILSKADFEDLLGSHGISEDSTVVLYGDNSNWFAAYTYWQFKYYGHEDVRLLNGGRDYWIDNDYPMTDEKPEFSAVKYDAKGPYEGIRAYRDDVELAIDRGLPLVDVRSPEEFKGEILAPPGLQETAQRGGHIPGAENISWAATVNDDGTFKSAEELRELFESHGITGDSSAIAYCRIGERSSIAWFAMHELLGWDDIVNYDGSWTEWGNLVGAPIETGEGGNT